MALGLRGKSASWRTPQPAAHDSYEVDKSNHSSLIYKFLFFIRKILPFTSHATPSFAVLKSLCCSFLPSSCRIDSGRDSTVVKHGSNRRRCTNTSLMASKVLTHNDYTVGWVCALPKEQTAATAMLDQEHADLPKPQNDHNIYTLGCVGNHNVVIACLPKGEVSNNASAAVATRMTSTFPSIKFGLMVGIGGGVPPTVRLGDVVVGTPADGFGGVVQWDLGKAEQGGTFKNTGALNNPPRALRTVLTKLETKHEMRGSMIPQYLEDLKTNWPRLAARYTRSESLEDILFRADYNHVKKKAMGGRGIPDNMGEDRNRDGKDEEEEEKSCTFCDRTKVVRRKPRDMLVHYGLIASGNQVIKDAAFRDKINERLGGGVLCFEMEAAGLVNDFPCIVIRGICDYADSHKNKDWQEHAAAVAAAFAKEFLSMVPVHEVDQLPTILGKLCCVYVISDVVGGQGNVVVGLSSEWNRKIHTGKSQVIPRFNIANDVLLVDILSDIQKVSTAVSKSLAELHSDITTTFSTQKGMPILAN